jgi:hypothetical protein
VTTAVVFGLGTAGGGEPHPGCRPRFPIVGSPGSLLEPDDSPNACRISSDVRDTTLIREGNRNGLTLNLGSDIDDAGFDNL